MNSKEVAKQIRKIRRDKEISQEKLGRLSDLSTSIICRWENEGRNLSIDSAERALNVLGYEIYIRKKSRE